MVLLSRLGDVPKGHTENSLAVAPTEDGKSLGLSQWSNKPCLPGSNLFPRFPWRKFSNCAGPFASVQVSFSRLIQNLVFRLISFEFSSFLFVHVFTLQRNVFTVLSQVHRFWATGFKFPWHQAVIFLPYFLLPPVLAAILPAKMLVLQSRVAEILQPNPYNSKRPFPEVEKSWVQVLERRNTTLSELWQQEMLSDCT